LGPISKRLEQGALAHARQGLARERPEKLVAPDAPNMVWSMDFMADRL